MKRVGYLFEKVIEIENCKAAVLEGTKSLRRSSMVKRIRENPDKYAKDIKETIECGWKPEPVRRKTINEGTAKKVRELIIPTMKDHLIHVAIMRVAVPYIIKRYDFASCGSIPGRGQSRAQAIIKGWMKKPPKYAAECDVKHFYQTCNKNVVIGLLRRIFKDEKYISLHELILDQMGGFLAIGFQPSHWYGNLVLTECDRMLRCDFGKVKFVRYMDNYLLTCGRKRTLHKAIKAIAEKLKSMNMELKGDWQVYPISKRPIRFLSYRYFYDGRIVMRKPLMYKVTKEAKKAAKNPSEKKARTILSLVGILRHCDSYNYRNAHVYPVTSISKCRKVVSNADKKRNAYRTAQRI